MQEKRMSPLLDPVGPGVGALSFCSSLLATRRKAELQGEGILVLDALFKSMN